MEKGSGNEPSSLNDSVNDDDESSDSDKSTSSSEDVDFSSSTPDSNDSDSSTELNGKELKKELETISGQETELMETLKKYKGSLIEVHQEIVRKESQAQKLRKKINDLRRRRAKTKGVKEEDWRKQDGEDPLLLFPREIWEMILEQLKNPAEFMNCSWTCDLFRNVLLPSRRIWKFGQIFPQISQYLSNQDVLKTRLVCKHWRNGIDKAFQNQDCLRPPSTDGVTVGRSPSYINIMTERGLRHRCLLTKRTLPFYFRILSTIPENPLIGGCLSIVEYRYTDDDMDERIFWQEMRLTFRKFCKHILYLSFHTLNYERTEWGRNRLLQFFKWDLIFVPNLRRLRIGGNLGNLYEEGVTTDLSCFPHFKQLETLQINDSFYTEATHPLLDALVKRYHGQLRGFHVNWKSWRTSASMNWSKLTELHISQVNIKDEEFKALSKLNVPNLQIFGLTFTYLVPETLQKILELLNSLAHTTKLNTFRMAGGIPLEFIKNIPPSLYAPSSLKTLEVEHCNFSNLKIYYAFLLKFPFIQNVHIFWRKPTPTDYYEEENEVEYQSEINLRTRDQFQEEWSRLGTDADPDLDGFAKEDEEDAKNELEQEIVEVNKYLLSPPCELYKSNIWNMLPRLNYFVFQKHVYSRDGFLNYEKRNA